MAQWQEIRIALNRTAQEGANAVLERWGIDNYVLEDSALLDQAREQGWGDYFPKRTPSQKITFICYLFEPLGEAELKRLQGELSRLETFGFEPGQVEISTGSVQEQDWALAWQAHYCPIRIGRVLIVPSWLDQREKPPGGSKESAEITVYLDPGMAFGSGTHPTTALCIEFLQGLNLEDRPVWDLGTGSGILAIVAAKLGGLVQAADTDAVAVQVAQENKVLNQVEFRLRRGSLEVLEGRPQIVVANITAQVIAALLPQISDLLEPGGFFIASGVIQARDGDILDLASQAGLRLLRRRQRGEWLGYLFQRGDLAD